MLAAMSIEAHVAQILQWIHLDRDEEGLPAIELTGDTALLDEGVFDSMKVLQFVSWLEGTFAITIGVDELTPAFFASPRTVAAGVDRLQASRDQAS